MAHEQQVGAAIVRGPMRQRLGARARDLAVRVGILPMVIYLVFALLLGLPCCWFWQ